MQHFARSLVNDVLHLPQTMIAPGVLLLSPLKKEMLNDSASSVSQGMTHSRGTKRPHSECDAICENAVCELAIDYFAHGQACACVGSITGAMEHLSDVLQLAEGATPLMTGSVPNTPIPPLGLVASAAHNVLGELHLDAAMVQCPQRSLAGAAAGQARCTHC